MAEKSLYYQNQKWLLNVNTSLNLVTICLLQNLKNLTEISKILGKMFSVVFFMFYICVICDCVCVLKYAIYLICPRQFSFGPDSSHLAHVFLIWLIPWPEQKMSQRGPWIAMKNDEIKYKSRKKLSSTCKMEHYFCILGEIWLLPDDLWHLSVNSPNHHTQACISVFLTHCSMSMIRGLLCYLLSNSIKRQSVSGRVPKYTWINYKQK